MLTWERGGVTLIELLATLVVLSIVALAVPLALPRGSTPDASALGAEVRRARLQALRTRRAQHVHRVIAGAAVAISAQPTGLVLVDSGGSRMLLFGTDSVAP